MPTGFLPQTGLERCVGTSRICSAKERESGKNVNTKNGWEKRGKGQKHATEMTDREGTKRESKEKLHGAGSLRS
jgi:hypothetical protein